jgi:hypothetical protein
VKQLLVDTALLVLLMGSAQANTTTRYADIIGGGGGVNGRCTIEVIVDGGAEVEISGDTGVLSTLSGQPAAWRRFQCNGPMPRNPVDFRFYGISGRGSARLLRDPRSSGGTAVIRLNDPQGGRALYTFALQWRGFGGGSGACPPAPSPVPPPFPPPFPPGGPSSGGFPMARAIQICQDSVTDRLNRDGYRYVTFERTIPDNNPGRNDWLVGMVNGRRGFETAWFSFACSVDFRTGRVRSVDVRRR